MIQTRKASVVGFVDSKSLRPFDNGQTEFVVFSFVRLKMDKANRYSHTVFSWAHRSLFLSFFCFINMLRRKRNREQEEEKEKKNK